MTPEQFAAKLSENIAILERAVESMSLEIAESTLTLIKDRSINEGIIIGGQPGNTANYSKNPIKTSGFKPRNRAGSEWLLANSMGTWHEFRKVQGLQSPVVNLSYTNEMWKNIVPLRTEKGANGKAQTVIGSNDEETNKKLSTNEFLFGDFLTPTDEELGFAQEVLRKKIVKLLAD